MATKNLARTVIEGGRAGRNKWERRYSHREERADLRAALAVVKDADDWDEAQPVPKRPVVYKGFTDKLNPVRRFLDANVGRPWSKVYAEVKAKFDMRTTAGRHVVHDHLLRDVAGSGIQEGSDERRWRPYHVDANGLLKKEPKRGRYHRVRGKQVSNKPNPKPPERYVDAAELVAWLGARRVTLKDERLYWVNAPEPCRAEYMVLSPGWGYGRERRLVWYRTDAKTGEIIVTRSEFGDHKYAVPTHGWKRGKALTRKEWDYWQTLPDGVRLAVLGEKPEK